MDTPAFACCTQYAMRGSTNLCLTYQFFAEAMPAIVQQSIDLLQQIVNDNVFENFTGYTCMRNGTVIAK